MSKEKPYRIDFDTMSRKIIEVYEVSPDGSQVRTKSGWVPSDRPNVITQRPPHIPGFMTAKQVEYAINAEKEILKDKKNNHTAAYLVAKKYPIKEYLKGM